MERRQKENLKRAKHQELTQRKARNNHQRWTEKQEMVLSDPSMTTLEKALKLGRSFEAVRIRKRALGGASKMELMNS